MTVTRHGDAIMRGRPVSYTVKLAFAKLGKLQLELIEVIEGETIHREFLEETRGGVHHLGFFVDDIEKEVDRWREHGVEVLQEVRGTYAFMDTKRIGGVIFELISTRYRP